jgi:hypothetical protein
MLEKRSIARLLFEERVDVKVAISFFVEKKLSMRQSK